MSTRAGRLPGVGDSRQLEIVKELAITYDCEPCCFSFTYQCEKVDSPILFSEYFPNLQETLYFYRNNL